MVTLIHHMKTWILKSINEDEVRNQNRVAQQIEQKTRAVQQCLDAFELRVLARPTPTIDLTTLQAAVEILVSDVYAILEMGGIDPEILLIELAEDKVLDALFKPSVEPQHGQ